MKILVVAPIGGYGGKNTSTHRVRALRFLGFAVKVIDSCPEYGGSVWRLYERRLRSLLFRIGLPVSLNDLARDNSRLLEMVYRESYSLIWLEQAMAIDAQTLRKVRQRSPSTLVVGFSPDDMFGRHNQSQAFLEALPHYHVFITTKSYNVSELQSLGCRRVVFVGNGYDPETFKPWPVSDNDLIKFGGDVGFIGTYEPARAEIMLELARRGIRVRIWGGLWEKMKQQHTNLRIEYAPLYGDDFAKACNAFKINLCFLRKLNRDLQTTRSVEIPASGGFMLAERTNEHLDMFEEDREAVFFETIDELFEKITYYLSHPEKRNLIKAAGLKRCQVSGYDNSSRISVALSKILGNHSS